MARPNDPRAAAARVTTELAASRLNDDLEAELAMGEPDPEWARRAEEARADLSGRFGGFDRLHELSRDRPVGTSDRRHSGRRRSGSPKPAAKTAPAAKTPPGSTPPAAPKGAPGSTRKPAPRTTKRPPRRSGGGGRGAGQRVLQGTGISGAGRGATAFALQTLGLMLGLALLYLVLNNAERARQGGGLLDQTLSFLTGIVHGFVSPGDPLAPRASSSSSSGAAPRDETKLAGPGPTMPASDVLRGRPALGGFPRTTTSAPTTP